MSNTCFLLCDNSSNNELQLCPDCQILYYCSPACQAIHKGGRSKILTSITTPCLPFEVKFKKGIGRCLVAVRDIKSNELVLSDRAAIECPQSLPICPVCLSNLLEENVFSCLECKLPTCCSKCSERHYQYPECEVYKGLHSIDCKKGVPSIIYSSIGIIRYLMTINDVKEELPEHWMDKLMDHLLDMEEDKIINEYMNSLTEFISKDCSLKKYSLDEIKRAYGVLRVNSIGMEGVHSGRCLYPIVSMFSHSCVSNLFFEELNENEVLLLAQRDIPKGEELSIRYISFLVGTNGRQSLLMDQWYFKCFCVRCSDPTEMGTFSSCLRCEKPCDGLIKMKNSEQWSCDSCSKDYESLKIRNILGEAMIQFSKCECTDSIEYCESVLNDVQNNILSPKHFLIIKMIVHIISLYLRYQNISEMNEKTLIHFIKHHEAVLSYLDAVDPGRSSLIGTFLKHYASAKTTLLTQRMKNKNIEINDALKEMKTISFLEKQVTKMTGKYLDLIKNNH